MIKRASNMANAPRGRPPIGCCWGGGGWVDAATGEPHSAASIRERALRARRAYERKRYWDTSTKVRTRRLERSAKLSGRPLRPVQLKLDTLCDISPGGQTGESQACVHPSEKLVGTTRNSINDPWMVTSGPTSQRFAAVQSVQTFCPPPGSACGAVAGLHAEA